MKLYEMAFRRALDKVINEGEAANHGRARFDVYAQGYFNLLQSFLEHHHWMKIVGHEDLNYSRKPYETFDSNGNPTAERHEVPWLPSFCGSKTLNMNNVKQLFDMDDIPSEEEEFWWDAEDWISAKQSSQELTLFLSSLGDSSSMRRLVIKQNKMYLGIKVNKDLSVFRVRTPQDNFHVFVDFAKAKWHYEEVVPNQLFDVVEKYK